MMKQLTVAVLLVLCVITTNRVFVLMEREENYQVVDITKGASSQHYRIKTACAQAISEYEFHLMEKKEILWKIVLGNDSEDPRVQFFLNCGPILLPQNSLFDGVKPSRNETIQLQVACDQSMRDYESDLKKLEKNSFWKLVPEIFGQTLTDPQIQIALNCGPILLIMSSFSALI